MSWTDKHTAKLKAAWPGPQSVNQIADELGFPRRVIYYQAAEVLKLPPRDPKDRRPQRSARVAAKPAGRPISMPPPSPYKPRQDAWKVLDGSEPRTLLERPLGVCCWPVDGGEEQLFCCRPKSGHKTYCEAHRLISVRVA